MAEQSKRKSRKGLKIEAHKGGRTVSVGLRFTPDEKKLIERFAVDGLSQVDVIVYGLKLIANMPEAERVESLKKLL